MYNKHSNHIGKENSYVLNGGENVLSGKVLNC